MTKRLSMTSLTSCAPVSDAQAQSVTLLGPNQIPSRRAVEVVTFFMTEEEKINHLLDAMPYMKEEALIGYGERFLPVAKVEPAKKKRRGSPNQCIGISSLPACANQECGLGTMIEDAREGSVVCIACGLIQSLSILDHACTDVYSHSGVSPLVVHHYSRIVHWVENITSLQG